MNTRKVLCSLVLGMVCVVIPSTSHAQTTSDNPSVTAQLNDAKTIVAKIKKDAVQMESYARNTGLSWQTHSAALDKIKVDVNALQQNMRGLQSHRTVASPWQQEAIDRITGLANDLATNMNASIDRLSKSKSRPTAPPYPEYLKANTQIAGDLADEIDATIDYGQNKAKLDSLGQQLDSSAN
jgi:lambda repressor-like predicted transcriptional regulator